jgi:ribosome maturation factor RimP
MASSRSDRSVSRRGREAPADEERKQVTGAGSATSRADLEGLARRIVGACGLELVDLAFHRSRSGGVLRLDIDRAGMSGVGLDECQRVSRALGDALDAADLLPGPYHLEVSSPGLDRPIRTADDIRRNTGRRVCVVVEDPERRRTCHRGRLLGAEHGAMLLETDAEVVRLPLERILKATQDLPF